MPSNILFAQHGWADTYQRISALAERVLPPDSQLVAPNLGFMRTWLRIDPLIAGVEKMAAKTLALYPDVPIQIIGHSMGGLIWIEILARHPDWWPRVTALILLGSPVNGSHYGRMVDPIGIGVGIARDLSISRADKAELLAAQFPVLSIAGVIDCNGDHAVPLDATTFSGDKDVAIHNVDHMGLLNNPNVDALIRNFLAQRVPHPTPIDTIIRGLRAVTGMTLGERPRYCGAQFGLMFEDGHQLLYIDNRVRTSHVFLVDDQHYCRFAGFVGPIHRGELRQAVETMKAAYAPLLLTPAAV